MAEGINIKILPQVDSALENDRILIDRDVTGTVVIPFSAIVVNQNQVTFYSDFLNLSAYAYALSASTNAIFTQIDSINVDMGLVNTEVQNVETNILELSSNMTTFISGGISPSGLIVPEKVGVLYFSADTKDYFLSVGTLNVTDWKRILTAD